MIVIISENDWYGLIPTFNFSHGVFLPLFFNCIALQNNIEADLKFFSSFEAFQAKYKKTAGENPRRVFPPQNEMGEKPCGVFTKE